MTKEVPAYRWVVENLCESCANKSNSEQQQKPVPAAGKDVLIPQRDLDPSASDQPADGYQNVAASEGSSRADPNLGATVAARFSAKNSRASLRGLIELIICCAAAAVHASPMSVTVPRVAPGLDAAYIMRASVA